MGQHICSSCMSRFQVFWFVMWSLLLLLLLWLLLVMPFYTRVLEQMFMFVYLCMRASVGRVCMASLVQVYMCVCLCAAVSALVSISVSLSPWHAPLLSRCFAHFNNKTSSSHLLPQLTHLTENIMQGAKQGGNWTGNPRPRPLRSPPSCSRCTLKPATMKANQLARKADNLMQMFSLRINWH